MMEQEDIELILLCEHTKTTTTYKATLSGNDLKSSRAARLKPRLQCKNHLETGRRGGEGIQMGPTLLEHGLEEKANIIGSGILPKGQGFQVLYQSCQPWGPTPERQTPLSWFKNKWPFPEDSKKQKLQSYRVHIQICWILVPEQRQQIRSCLELWPVSQDQPSPQWALAEPLLLQHYSSLRWRCHHQHTQLHQGKRSQPGPGSASRHGTDCCHHSTHTCTWTKPASSQVQFQFLEPQLCLQSAHKHRR